MPRPPPQGSDAVRTAARRDLSLRPSAGFAGAIEGGRFRKRGAAPRRGNQRRPHAARRRGRGVAEGGRSRPHLGRHLYGARRGPCAPASPDREGRGAADRRHGPDHLLHRSVAGPAGHRDRLRRADDRQPHGQVHAVALEARTQGHDRQGLPRSAGEGRAEAVQGDLLRRDRRRRRRALRVREEGGGRGLRGPRHGGDPPARGGRLPGHRALRLPRRRSLPGRAEGLREGGPIPSGRAQVSARVTAARPPIAAPHLRRDAWWALPLTVVIVLGSFIVYSTWAAFQNAHYWAPPYLSPFYSPCLSATCLHVTFGYGLPEIQLPIIGILSPAFRFPRPAGGTEFGIGVGTLVMWANVILLAGYTFSCHSCRHVCGGHVDVFSKAPTRYRLWHVITRLNEQHPTFAWLSLFSVGLTDLYIRLVSLGVIRDLRII